MNIAIQASDLDHKRIDGTRVYVSELLNQFGKIDKESQFLLYHRGRFNPELAPRTFSNYHEYSLPFPMAWMQTRFAFEMFRHTPDKLFLPIQAAPFFLPRKMEVTVTIHDLAFKFYPETFPKKQLWKLNHFLDWAVARADKIIAVSESTKRDLLRNYPHFREERIKIISHGFSRDFQESPLPNEDIANILKPFGLLPKSYCLYVGALQPRKNLVALIQAFEIAKRKDSDLRLVLAGERAWLSESIYQAREKSQFKEDILFTGQLTFTQLRAFYQGARLFVFPSLYEGFGIPILEAFASKIPVIASSNSSLPEVAGGAALYCSAHDIEDMSLKLSRLWTDQALQAELIQKGEEQLKKFSWDRCAAETLDFIKNG